MTQRKIFHYSYTIIEYKTQPRKQFYLMKQSRYHKTIINSMPNQAGDEYFIEAYPENTRTKGNDITKNRKTTCQQNKPAKAVQAQH